MKGSFTKVSWHEVRDSLYSTNPILAEIIDDIAPANKLYRLTVEYGEEILKDGLFRYPDKKGLAKSFYDLPKRDQDELGYNGGANAAGIVLQGKLELFLNIDQRIAPYSVMSAGQLFSLSRILNNKELACPEELWGITSGVRSLFVLSKISDRLSHERLRKDYQIKGKKPEYYCDHWQIFREVYQSQSVEQWQSDILFFPYSWFKHLDDKRWLPFKVHLYEFAYKNSFWCHRYAWEIIFREIEKHYNFKRHAYLSDIIKHLFSVCMGILPAFEPAIDNHSAPVKLIQQAYLNSYQIGFMPIIMQPCYLTKSPVYLSLQYPSALEISAKSMVKSSGIVDLDMLAYLMNYYCQEITSGRLYMESTLLCAVLKKFKFNYFHNHPQHHKIIESSQLLIQQDKRFRTVLAKHDKGLIAAKNASFFRGCIRITPS